MKIQFENGQLFIDSNTSFSIWVNGASIFLYIDEKKYFLHTVDFLCGSDELATCLEFFIYKRLYKLLKDNVEIFHCTLVNEMFYEFVETHRKNNWPNSLKEIFKEEGV